MLIFKQLTLENFGPYLGVQKIQFPSKKGVVIIRARNGRGKTSLLRALRFVLFGSVKQKGKTNIDLIIFLNIISRNNGNYQYKVILDVELDGRSYEITRIFSPKPGILIPDTMDDYLFPKAVIKETTESGAQNILLELEVKRILKQIMDEPVARFYLFDGELLGEYETQLMGEQDAGAAKIKEGIENILGVPILTNALEHIDICHGEYSRNFESIIQSNKQTEKIGKAIESANTKREYYNEDIDSLNLKLLEIRDEISIIQGKLDKSSGNQELIKDQMKLENEREDLINTIKEKKEMRSTELLSAWKGVLSPILHAKNEGIDSEIKTIRHEKSERDTREKYITELQSSLENNRCKLCNQALDKEASRKLQTLLKECNTNDLSKLNLTIIDNQLLKLQNHSKYIAEFTKDHSIQGIIDLESKIESLETNLIFKDKDLDEINQEVKLMTLSRKDYLDLIDERDKLKLKEKSTKDGLSLSQQKLKDTEETIEKLEIQLNLVSNDDEVEKAKHKRNFVKKLSELVNEGISQYKDDLKKRVEEDATSLFIKLSDEKEYKKLRIDNNYGLEIIHEDGGIVPLRSSGYEHLVAFSLIGALHKNAPLQGPLFMDTSFGRLDRENSENLIRVLPELSEQVILLVHDREIDEELVRSLIPNAIKAEYTIDKISARESHLKLIEGCN